MPLVEIAFVFIALGFMLTAGAFLLLAREVASVANRLVPPAPNLDAFPAPEEIPSYIQNLVDMESETWAKQDLEGRARELYGEHGDWDRVHTILLEEVGDPHDVANRAWQMEPTVVEEDGTPIAEGF